MVWMDVFAKTEGPYIPEEHAQYDLLPESRENGGEVFSYPAELSEIDSCLSRYEDGEGVETHFARLIPYGQKSYAEYFGLLRGYREKYLEIDPELADNLAWLIGAIKRMNIKEDWSIVRYVGHQFDDEETSPAFGLTHGRCYYWPCSRENPVYEGVIDDEEFTSYYYPCDPESWEIVSDPTGMAARALSNEGNKSSSWSMEITDDEGSLNQIKANLYLTISLIMRWLQMGNQLKMR